jgi:hypothetical protein
VRQRNAPFAARIDPVLERMADQALDDASSRHTSRIDTTIRREECGKLPATFSRIDMRTIASRAMLAGLACVLAACGTGYRNGQTCKQKMIATYPTVDVPLSVDATKIAHRGARVVVEGSFKDVSRTLVTTQVKGGQTNTVKTATIDIPAAVECTFTDETMTSFRWLTPLKFAWVYEPVAEAEPE